MSSQQMFTIIQEKIDSMCKDANINYALVIAESIYSYIKYRIEKRVNCYRPQEISTADPLSTLPLFLGDLTYPGGHVYAYSPADLKEIQLQKEIEIIPFCIGDVTGNYYLLGGLTPILMTLTKGNANFGQELNALEILGFHYKKVKSFAFYPNARYTNVAKKIPHVFIRIPYILYLQDIITAFGQTISNLDSLGLSFLHALEVLPFLPDQTIHLILSFCEYFLVCQRDIIEHISDLYLKTFRSIFLEILPNQENFVQEWRIGTFFKEVADHSSLTFQLKFCQSMGDLLLKWVPAQAIPSDLISFQENVCTTCFSHVNKFFVQLLSSESPPWDLQFGKSCINWAMKFIINSYSETRYSSRKHSFEFIYSSKTGRKICDNLFHNIYSLPLPHHDSAIPVGPNDIFEIDGGEPQFIDVGTGEWGENPFLKLCAMLSNY